MPRDASISESGYECFFSEEFCILMAHYTERGALLYHNLFNCFDSTIDWKGRPSVSELF